MLDCETATGLDRVVTRSEAELVFNDLQGYEYPCTEDDAIQAAQSLVGFYPAREVTDAKRYCQGVTALMAAYPLYAVKRVCNPVVGLPSRLKWLPTLAEIKQALDDEKARRGRMRANALAVLKSYRERDERAEYERTRGTAEERARKVAELLRPWRSEDAA